MTDSALEEIQAALERGVATGDLRDEQMQLLEPVEQLGAVWAYVRDSNKLIGPSRLIAAFLAQTTGAVARMYRLSLDNSSDHPDTLFLQPAAARRLRFQVIPATGELRARHLISRDAAEWPRPAHAGLSLCREHALELALRGEDPGPAFEQAARLLSLSPQVLPDAAWCEPRVRALQEMRGLLPDVGPLSPLLLGTLSGLLELHRPRRIRPAGLLIGDHVWTQDGFVGASARVSAGPVPEPQEALELWQQLLDQHPDPESLRPLWLALLRVAPDMISGPAAPDTSSHAAAGGFSPLGA